MKPTSQAITDLNVMKKSIICTLPFLMCMLLLSSCTALSARELKVVFSSRPPAVTMPYEQPEYILHSVPEELPFFFVLPAGGELLGAVEDTGQARGTILLKSDQSASDILEHFTNLLMDSTFTSTSESHRYQVFFPPEENGATFCSEQGTAVILEIFELEDGLKDVRLHYAMDGEAIKYTACGQPMVELEDFRFPYLSAPPNASVAGGGGGGGGKEEGTRPGLMGYSVEIVINSTDDLDFVADHYKNLLSVEGWTLLNQSLSEHSYTSDWDFGFYETRSWLARLIVSAGDAPDQYTIELRAISP
jgi:hypothetical protein